MTYQIQTHALIVKPIGEPIYSDFATIIRLDDEGAGLFVVIEQHSRSSNKVSINPEEWPTLRDAIDRMIELCEPVKPHYRHPLHTEFTWNGKGDKPCWMREWIAAGNDPMDCRVQ